MRWSDILERLWKATGLTDRQLAKLEKRKALRVTRRFGLIGIREGGENVPLMALDCAATGMRVECAERLKKGEILTLTLRAPDARRPSINPREVALARAVWIRKQKNLLTHEVGLGFVLDTQDQRRGVAYFLLHECKVGIANPRENRQAPRVGANVRAQIKIAGREAMTATVKDIAVGGLLLISPESLERRIKVEVAVFLPGTSSPLECAGDVVRCAKIDHVKHELGIVFTSVPDDHKERLVSYLSKLLQAH